MKHHEHKVLTKHKKNPSKNCFGLCCDTEEFFIAQSMMIRHSCSVRILRGMRQGQASTGQGSKSRRSRARCLGKRAAPTAPHRLQCTQIVVNVRANAKMSSVPLLLLFSVLRHKDRVWHLVQLNFLRFRESHSAPCSHTSLLAYHCAKEHLENTKHTATAHAGIYKIPVQ